MPCGAYPTVLVRSCCVPSFFISENQQGLSAPWNEVDWSTSNEFRRPQLLKCACNPMSPGFLKPWCPLESNPGKKQSCSRCLVAETLQTKSPCFLGP